MVYLYKMAGSVGITYILTSFHKSCLLLLSICCTQKAEQIFVKNWNAKARPV